MINAEPATARVAFLIPAAKVVLKLGSLTSLLLIEEPPSAASYHR
jgi:hypothetical protein